MVTLTEFEPLARLTVSLPPPMSMDSPLTLLRKPTKSSPPRADKVLDVGEVEVVTAGHAEHDGVVAAGAEVDQVVGQVLADLDEIVGGSGQRRQRIACRVEEQPVVGKIDRVRRASGRDQDVGVGELHDLDIRQRVGAVAVRDGVRDRGLAGRRN